MPLFPVMQRETKYGVDYRVGATEANIRSGSILIGKIQARDKMEAIATLKHHLRETIDFLMPG